jgi:hypothetical protein
MSASDIRAYRQPPHIASAHAGYAELLRFQRLAAALGRD